MAYLIIATSLLLMRFWWTRVRLLLRGDSPEIVAVLSRDSRVSRTFWENCHIRFFGPDAIFI